MNFHSISNKWNFPNTGKSGEKVRELDSRDEALLQFASSLLKRTLSESFVGVPITEDGLSNSDDSGMQEDIQKQKIILNARSLSLELAKHKHKIAAQLVSTKKFMLGCVLLYLILSVVPNLRFGKL